jgi:hypothetical protein
MMFGIAWQEWIGYFGSVLVAFSLTMSSIKRLRWYNLLGASVFAFYGFMIGALPVALLNLFIVVTNIFYLLRMYSHRDEFKLIRVENSDAYLSYFLNFHQKEIKQFFPDFNSESWNKTENRFTVLLIRNAAVAGVFSGLLNEGILKVEIDFVTAPYRDLKPGQFIYGRNSGFFNDAGISRFHAFSKNEMHRHYLLKMGFSAPDNQNEDLLIKNI